MRTAAHVAKSGRSPRRVYSRPASDDQSSVAICGRRIVADGTAEGGLIGPVLFCDVSTSAAFSPSIAWINQHEQHSGQGRFIGDKEPQLREGPTMQNRPLLAPSPDPKANTPEVLQDNRPLCAFSASNNLLGDYYVIGVSGKTSLFTGELLQTPFSRASLLLLQFGPQATATVTNRTSLTAAVALTIRIASDVHHAEVHAKSVGRLSGYRFFYFACRSQVKRPTAIDQVRFPMLPAQQLPLPRPASKRDVQPARKRPDRNGLVFDAPSQHAGIIGYTPERTKAAFTVPIRLVGLGDLRDTAHDHLCSQAELFPRPSVGDMVKIVSPKLLRIPSLLGEPVATLIGLMNGGQQRCALVLGRFTASQRKRSTRPLSASRRNLRCISGRAAVSLSCAIITGQFPAWNAPPPSNPAVLIIITGSESYMAAGGRTQADSVPFPRFRWRTK